MNRECRTNDIMLIWWGFITYSPGLTWKTVLSLLSLCFTSKLQQDFCQQKLSVPIEGSISSAQELPSKRRVCLFGNIFFSQITFLPHQNFFFFQQIFPACYRTDLWHTHKTKIQSVLVCTEQNIVLWLSLSVITKQCSKLLLQEVWSNLCNFFFLWGPTVISQQS